MRLLALLLLALSIEAQEHGQFSGEARNRAIGDPASIAAGAKLYATSCAGCHGPDGSGGRGPNLIHRAASNPLSDRTLFSTIRDGLPGTDMPPTKLPDDQTWNLVAFIRVLTGPAVQNTVPGDPSADERIFWGEMEGGSD